MVMVGWIQVHGDTGHQNSAKNCKYQTVQIPWALAEILGKTLSGYLTDEDLCIKIRWKWQIFILLKEVFLFVSRVCSGTYFLQFLIS